VTAAEGDNDNGFMATITYIRAPVSRASVIPVGALQCSDEGLTTCHANAITHHTCTSHVIRDRRRASIRRRVMCVFYVHAVCICSIYGALWCLRRDSRDVSDEYVVGVVVPMSAVNYYNTAVL